MNDGYTCLWEFTVAQAARAEFERHYGEDGSWVRLFRQSPGFIGTILLRDRNVEGRYLTVDRWRSEAAYRAFRADFARQYDQLDIACERLTETETSLGEFHESVA